MAHEQAMELLASLKARFVLGAYGAPASPSEMARAVGMPANTVHYWTKKLAEAGLLEQISESGRVRTYKSTVPNDVCQLEDCAPFVQNAMDALHKVVMAAAKRYDLVGAEAGASLPQVGVHELNLRPAVAERLANVLKESLPEYDDHAGAEGEPYTVAFIVAPGRMSDHVSGY